MSRRKLTADLLAFAYELKCEGIQLKAISAGIGVHYDYLSKVMSAAERDGLASALNHSRRNMA